MTDAIDGAASEDVKYRPLVIYHANCHDGFCAAWVAHKVLGDEADYHPANYGEATPKVDGRNVYILDFSYPRDVMKSIMSKCNALTVLDHHRSAEKALAGIVDEFIEEAKADPNREAPDRGWYEVVFDMAKSGARLAWEHFFPGLPSPWLVEYVQDRDLWSWKLRNSREINSGLSITPLDFAVWDRLYNYYEPPHDLFVKGEAIEVYKATLVDSICKGKRPVMVGGHTVFGLNTSVLISEVGHELCKGAPFSVTWFEKPDGTRINSLRSDESGMDVSEIARKYGGGGHKHAAGFTIKPSDPDPMVYAWAAGPGTKPSTSTSTRPSAASPNRRTTETSDDVDQSDPIPTSDEAMAEFVEDAVRIINRLRDRDLSGPRCRLALFGLKQAVAYLPPPPQLAVNPELTGHRTHEYRRVDNWEVAGNPYVIRATTSDHGIIKP